MKKVWAARSMVAAGVNEYQTVLAMGVESQVNGSPAWVVAPSVFLASVKGRLENTRAFPKLSFVGRAEAGVAAGKRASDKTSNAANPTTIIANVRNVRTMLTVTPSRARL